MSNIKKHEKMETKNMKNVENQSINNEIRAMYKKHVAIGESKNSMSIWWNYIEQFDSQTIKNAVESIQKAEQRLRNYKNSPLFLNKIRKYANHIMWSDVQSYEIIKIVSNKCVVIRRMDATMIEKPQNFEIGGFSAICLDNYNQKWSFASNENNPTMKIRLTKTGWKNGNFKFAMSDEPCEFYDYNF